MPQIQPGDPLADLICSALNHGGLKLLDSDVVVVTQKVVSKAEGRLAKLSEIIPSPFALTVASELDKDPRMVEVALREAKRIVRMDKGVLITETHQGFVCANSGVDKSNVEPDQVTLLPLDPDASARRIRERIKQLTGVNVAVVISDTWGRPWRNGLVNFAIGCSGIAPIKNYVGKKDQYGYVLNVTEIAMVDEIAAIAELAMGKLSDIPAVIVRGCEYDPADVGIKELLRAAESDLFR
ncbi:MAG TPA: coenzyme F420-0:L-glutamate ligase [Firmicutes bacterium]|nr:coenzyme F420-0:L-glutamate ligase [Bacillota bacterium]